MVYQDRKIQGRIRSCPKCGAAIYWMITSNFKKIPVDKATAHDSETHYDPQKHVNHFGTCIGAPRENRAEVN